VSGLRTTAEDDDEGLAKLTTHCTEQNKVDGAVDQDQDVE